MHYVVLDLVVVPIEFVLIVHYNNMCHHHDDYYVLTNLVEAQMYVIYYCMAMDCMDLLDRVK